MFKITESAGTGILEITGPVRTLRSLQAQLSDGPDRTKLRLRMVPTIPADSIIYINDLTPSQQKRLKTMSRAERKALAKRQWAKRLERSKPA